MSGLLNNFVPFFLYSDSLEKANAQDLFDFDDYLRIFQMQDKPFFQEFTQHNMVLLFSFSIFFLNE
jgi:hypothetical protein